MDISLEALLTFERLQHRYEILGIRNGLTYINDSKSTNISSLFTLELSLKFSIKVGSKYQPFEHLPLI